ncbi:hypothetical protein IWQ62_004162, partial [Dispira parvispora]
FAPTQQVHIETITASLESGQRIKGGIKGAQYLLITQSDYNKFDVATCLCKLLFARCRLNDALLLETLLSTSLAHLKRKGFPVERVLNYPKPVAPAAPPPSSTPTRSDSQSSPVATNTTKPSSETKLPNLPPALQPHLRQLQGMFPDCDPGYLQRCLMAEKHDHVTQVSNKLLDQGYPRRAREEASSTGECKAKDSAPISNPVTSDQREHPPKPTEPENQVPSSDSLGSNPTGLFGRFTRQLQTSINDLYKGYDSLIPPAPGGSSTPQNSIRGTEESSSSRNELSTSSSNGSSTGPDAIPGGFPTTSSPSTQSNGSWKPSNTIPLDYTERVNRSLMSSINSCVRNATPFHGTQADQPTIPPPPKDYTEQRHDDYCSVVQAHRMAPIGCVGDVDVYLTKDLTVHEVFSCDWTGSNSTLALLPLSALTSPVPLPSSQLVPVGSAYHALHALTHVLKFLIGVFQLPEHSVHIYYDRDGTAIAFNRGRSLFFNLRFFILLHHLRLLTEGQAVDVYNYWFMVTCHELAHNFVSDHNSQHEFYMSSFAEQFLRPFFGKLLAQGHTFK